MLQARIPGRRNDWECLVQQFFQKSWFDLWFDITQIIPGSVGCFQARARTPRSAGARSRAAPRADAMRTCCAPRLRAPRAQANLELKWDMWRHEYLDNGVQTRLVEYGDVGGVRCIVPAMESTCTLTEVFSKMAYHLERMGYVAGSNLHGAPYDWRTGPMYWTKPGGAFSQLQRLIESSVQLNSGRKAVLVAVSEGAPYTLWFLNNFVTPVRAPHARTPARERGPRCGAARADGLRAHGHSRRCARARRRAAQAWKAKYVEAFVPIAGSFGGSLQSVRMVLSGYLWGINSKSLPWIDGSILAEVSRTFGGVTWSFPMAIPGHAEDWPIVQTPHRSWSASQLDSMLHQVDLHTTADIYNATKRYHTFAPPGVKTYCFYGAGVPTPATLRYTSEDVYDPAMLQYDEVDGDGAVMLDSLNMCDVWAEADPQMYTVVRLTNATHIQTIHRAEKYVLAIANGTIAQMLRKLGADLVKVEDAPEAVPGARAPAPHATEGDSLTPYVQLATTAAAVVGLLLVAAPISAGFAVGRRLRRSWTHAPEHAAAIPGADALASPARAAGRRQLSALL